MDNLLCRIKFQRKKRDNVKALQATLKELQGIDPLDYLAKSVPSNSVVMVTLLL